MVLTQIMQAARANTTKIW